MIGYGQFKGFGIYWIINGDNQYSKTSQRQTRQLQAGATSTKQKCSSEKTHFAVFASLGSIMLKYIKMEADVGLAPVMDS